MKKVVFCLFVFLFTACDTGKIPEVKPGEIQYIPFSELYAFGTDSSIVIFHRQSGKVTGKINRVK